MDDAHIVTLYWDWNEQAIIETDKKYRNYCYVISNNILKNVEDTDENINDTYLHTWNSIPPKRPKELKTFLGKIARQLAIDKWRKKSADKRSYELTVALDELADCIFDYHNLDEEIQARELAELINQFLWELPENPRRLFVRRYWYVESISSLSHEFGYSQSKVTSMLLRVRKKLMKFLDERWNSDES